ncbi:twin-arginine translocase subunit TatC [Enorma massiliensis]|uniref:twin-arginine translocase subunit TatC n=1 Tax=Enorma massiliensis TaxID=1472761 RepID=UPI003AEFC998
MPVGPARMPLLDHLGELRRRLTIVIVTIIVATVVFYFAAPTVIDVLTDPIAPFVDGEFYVMSALGGFSLRFSIALKTACVVCVPMVLWQILGFFLPALKPNERKWVVPTLFIATALFFVGAVFCYFFIVPPGFEWLINETNSIATAFADLENYLNIEVLLMIGFGVAFELPLFVFYLAVFHIVPYVTFRAAWRYIYVAMAVIAATVTPDANPVTMIFMYAVLLSLYELSLFVTRFVIIAREGKAGLKGSRVGFFSDEDDEE